MELYKLITKAESALGHINCLSVWLLVVWMSYVLGQKKCEMWKCGIITPWNQV